MIGLFIIFCIMMVSSVVLGILGELIGLGFELIMDFAFPAIFIYSIVRLIKTISDRNKITNKRTNTKNTNNEEARLINSLRSYFKTDSRLYFDDETYITPGDPDNINLDTLELYMRDEFISNLSDYKTAFPNSFNTFTSMISDYLKRKKTSRKTPTKTETVSKEPQPSAKKKDTTVKGAQYYIDVFEKLNSEISEEHITDDLKETVMYLQQIKKIEDNFPNCQDKTKKLYQYYMPMLVDILENYKRLSINADLHKEFKENEDRLIKTLVLINGALKTLTQSLVDEYYTELSVDMKTLEALLKKDGLASDEMTFENFRKNEDTNKKVNSDGN